LTSDGALQEGAAVAAHAGWSRLSTADVLLARRFESVAGRVLAASDGLTSRSNSEGGWKWD
jgi:hypothetical protein